MKRATRLKGRIWIIAGPDGKLIDDIDTDMIYHNAHLAVTDIEKMGQYTFGNLEGWKDFPSLAAPGDMVLCGKNFGSGSSRQHAVDCFKALGITAIIAESFGAIYKRNAINAGFPVLSAVEYPAGVLQSEQLVELDLEKGEVTEPASGKILFQVNPFNQVQMDIYQAGNIFEFGKTLK